MSTVSKHGGSVVVSRKGQILGKIGPEDIVAALERHQADD